MTTIREELVNVALDRARVFNVLYDDIKRFKFRRQTVLVDKSFTKDETNRAVIRLDELSDKAIYNDGRNKKSL